MPTKNIERIVLPPSAMGDRKELCVITYGAENSGQKAYLQAGLHADESPGVMTMHCLLALLDEADRKGLIQSQIVLVPVANPIGGAQWDHDRLVGRFDRATGVNFNRGHLELIGPVAEKIAGRLADDANHNKRVIRAALAKAIAAVSPKDQAGHLKKLLLSMAYDADIALDLHCDEQALLHVYLGTPLWPAAVDLSAQLGAAVTLLASDSGGSPYDEALSKIWWQLPQRFPEYPIEPACLAATVELRGTGDVSYDYGRNDAQNIFRFLQRRGYIAGTAPPLPPLPKEATPLRGVEHVTAPSPGVVAFLRKPGEVLRAGDIVAHIINPVARSRDERVVDVKTGSGGLLFAHIADRWARPGRILAKIAGDTPIDGKGLHLLTD